MEPSQDWLIHILDTIDEGIHAVDEHGVTIVYNQAASRMDGLAVSDVLEKHVLVAFPSLGQETSTLLRVLQTGKGIHDCPQTYTNVFGVKIHTVNTTLPIISGGRTLGALEIAKDLTQVKRLSEQVLDLQAQVVTNQRKGPWAKDQSHMTAVYDFSQFLTQDKKTLEMKEWAARAARTASPVLIYGETGTGKELVVQSIHNAGPRRHQPFLAINCAALPSSLLEGILFGTVRGSFTGAEDRPGMFELANHGTLFLDEVQSTPLELQAKLLRVLQEGDVMRVGDTRVRKLDVRVIAAMNQSPETAVASGLLRNDLYYRMNVVRLNIPPLRLRPDDIVMLTHHFIRKWNGRFSAQVDTVSDTVIDLFRRYPWPGNVRELENAIESAMNIVREGTIRCVELPAHLQEWAMRDGSCELTLAENSALLDQMQTSRPRSSTLLPEWARGLADVGMDDFWQAIGPKRVAADGNAASWRSLQTAFERLVLERAVTSNHGNVRQTASRLGIPRQTLQYRLQQLDLL